MSSTTRASEIATLSDQLRPIGRKARGMRLSAEDWNVIVGAITAMLKIDREQDEDMGTRLDQAYARADHQHVGQVSLDWLDPELQSLVGAGGGTVATRKALAAVEETVESLRNEVARLTEVVDRQQNLIDRVLAADSDRSEQLRDFEVRFGSLEDLRATVGTLAQAQKSIRTGVEDVVKLRAQLSDAAGAPIDFSNLTRRVADLQLLRESLTGIDGNPLRLKDLQLEVKQLAGKIPAGGGGIGAPGLDSRLVALTEDLQKRASEDAEQRIDVLRDEIKSARGEIVADVDTRLAVTVAESRATALDAARGLVNDAETRIGTNLAGQLSATRIALTATLQQQAGEAVAGGLAGVDERMGGLLEARAETLRTQLAGEIQETVTSRLDKSFAEAVQTLDFRLADAESRIGEVTQSIPLRLEEGMSAIRGGLGEQIKNQIVNEAASLRLSLTNLVDQRVKTGLDSGLIEIRATASETVSAALSGVDERIKASVTSATRSLLENVRSTVDTRITEFNFPGQIAAASNEITSTLRSEIAVSAANVTRTTATTINSAIVGLRGELTTADTAVSLKAGAGTRFPGGFVR